ncbi:hypothetical protein B0J14DRAFT_555850 [Halenospora varia]|nr:hypothetical protein B0J14DRAFT_555850 [Halenospora varia]
MKTISIGYTARTIGQQENKRGVELIASHLNSIFSELLEFSRFRAGGTHMAGDLQRPIVPGGSCLQPPNLRCGNDHDPSTAFWQTVTGHRSVTTTIPQTTKKRPKNRGWQAKSQGPVLARKYDWDGPHGFVQTLDPRRAEVTLWTPTWATTSTSKDREKSEEEKDSCPGYQLLPPASCAKVAHRSPERIGGHLVVEYGSYRDFSSNSVHKVRDNDSVWCSLFTPESTNQCSVSEVRFMGALLAAGLQAQGPGNRVTKWWGCAATIS